MLSVRDAAGAQVGQKTIRVSASAELSVEAPRPNPSRGAAVVPYAVPEAGRVRVSVIDLLGREVAVLVDGERAAGHRTETPDASALAPGVYVVRLTTGTEALVRHVVAVR